MEFANQWIGKIFIWRLKPQISGKVLRKVNKRQNHEKFFKPFLYSNCLILFLSFKILFLAIFNVYFSSSRNQLNWNQWLELPVEYCELSREAVIAVRLIDTTTNETIGGSVLSLFSETGEFHHGAKDICLWPGREPDPVRVSARKVFSKYFSWFYKIWQVTLQTP